MSEDEVRACRRELGVRPAFKRVDTCAAEFATATAYMYSTYETDCEADPSERKRRGELAERLIHNSRGALARLLELVDPLL